jgi:serine protease inhibitor
MLPSSRLPRAAFPLALFILAAGCGDPPTGPSGGVDEITRLPRALSAAEVEVIGASNRFTFDLLKKANRPDSNLFLSPLSASMALGMTMNGAAGETWNQMRGVLGFGNLTQEEINDAYRTLLELLVGLDSTVETAIANSVWAKLGVPFHEAFLDAVRDAFDAEVEALDFASPGASDRINGWVDEKTRGRIEDIVPEVIPPEVVMYLINAIYFKGTWTFQFDRSDTRGQPFHLANGSSRTVPLMTLQGDLPYRLDDRFQAVDLPYGGRAFSMTVLLPHEGVTVDDVVASLDEATWAEIADGFQETEVQLFLPRFRMAYERTLNDDLKALGMVDAFDGRADFSRLSPVPTLQISAVKQKSWVDVNEEGTEAAAVTVVEIIETSLPQIPVVRVDRPFLFVIRERLSGTILFVGKIAGLPEA